MIMKFLLFFILLGVIELQIAHGWLDQSRFGEQSLHVYANELIKPLMKKTQELNQTIQHYWERYDQNEERINSQLNKLRGLSQKVSTKENDTCLELLDTMSNAQNTVNNATVLLVEVLQKMAVVINRSPSCLTIKIFSAISCSAHKAQDVRNIYLDYKVELMKKEAAAAKNIEEIVNEFIHCIKRL